MKKTLYSLGILLALASCKGDYDDWGNPITNAEDAAKTVTMSVTGVDLIDYSTLSDDVTTVKVFSSADITADEQKGNVSYEVELTTADGNTASFTTDENGYVDKTTLSDIVEGFYGKRPETRTMSEKIVAHIDFNGTSIRKEGTTSLQVKLEAPFIDTAYYLTGGINSWDNTNTTYKFVNSGADVYDDPVFTGSIPASDVTGDFEFKLTPETGLGGDWSLCVSASADGESGKISSTNAGGNLYITYDPDAVRYDLTFNLLDMTWSYTVIKFGEYIYLPGDANGWTFDQDFLRGANYDGEYLGFAMIGGQWGWKITPAQNWDMSYGAGSSDGVIANGGGNIMEGSTATLYYANVNLASLTYTLTPIESVSIIGAPTGDSSWGTDVDLTQSSDNKKVWTYTGHLEAGEFKFRMNHGWDVNLGGASADALEQNGANLSIATAGDYTITLTLSANGISSYTIQ